MSRPRGRSGFIARVSQPRAGGARSAAGAGPAPGACARVGAESSLPPLPALSPASLPPGVYSCSLPPSPLPPPPLHPPRPAPYGPPSPAKSREPRDLPICMLRGAPFRPLCGQKKVAHLSPVRGSADLFLPAGEINPFGGQKGEEPPGKGRRRRGDATSRSGKAHRPGWGPGEEPASGREVGSGGRGRNTEIEARSAASRLLSTACPGSALRAPGLPTPSQGPSLGFYPLADAFLLGA